MELETDMSLEETLQNVQTLESWVKEKVDDWRDHYESNYKERDDEFLRLFRGVWREEDKTRKSERSKIISPATLQAVESAAAEIEEAVFGRGKFFVIEDDAQDPEKRDVAKLRDQLDEEFNEQGFRSKIREVILTSAIFGNGMAEIIVEEKEQRRPATKPTMGGEMQSYGVEIEKKVVVDIIPLQPRQFLIDPAATCIDDGLGAAVDRHVSPYKIEILQEEGVYLKTETSVRDIGTVDAADTDPELPKPPEEDTRLVKYFGLVPRHLLEAAELTQEQQEDREEDDFFDEGEEPPEEEKSYYVEAQVVMTHDGVLLKAQENPHMMRDRDVINFTWDTLPGQFRGRGVVEKGYNIQKAIDAEIRGRIDAMAYTIHPMMGIDATKMTKGMGLEVAPGKLIPTMGDPNTVLRPFNFGSVSEITFPQAQALEGLHQRATGAIDSIPRSTQGETPAAAMSMSHSAAVKRFKRSQNNFEDQFLMPLIRKVSWRKMQYDTENFPVQDYKFKVRGGLGIIAREYEVGQLSQVLQVIDAQHPLFLPVLEAIIQHLSISDREQFIEQLREAAKPDPEAQKRAQEAHQMQMRQQSAQAAAFEGAAAESQARAGKYAAETQVIPDELQLEMIDTILKHQNEVDPQFKQRLEIVRSALEERKLNLSEHEAVTKRMQTEGKILNERINTTNGNGAVGVGGAAERSGGAG